MFSTVTLLFFPHHILFFYIIMPRTCTICNHSRRDEIDQLLVSGVTFRTISRKYAISEDALKRHKKSHLPKTLMESRHAEIVMNADNILLQMQELCDKTNRILDAAIDAGDTRTALAAIREARGNNELISKLIGQLPGDSHVTAVTIYLPDNGRDRV